MGGQHGKTVFWLGCLLTTILWLSPSARAGSSRCRVQYVSAEHVYLDAGEAAGLAVADTLSILRDEEPIARVAVVFVAQHSACCIVVEARESLRSGDLVKLDRAPPPTPIPPTPPARRQRSFTPRAGTEPMRRGQRITGNLALQWYQLVDRSESGLDFTQPGLRMNLRVRELFGSGLTLRLKGTVRHDQRVRRFSADLPAGEWRNRVYLFALESGDPGSPFHFRLGRVTARQIAGAGALDGVFVARQLSRSTQAGVFAGLQPDHRTSEPTTNVRLYGLFVEYQAGAPAGSYLRVSASGIGQYHLGSISREYLNLTAELRTGDRLHLHQNAELDLNRGWRRDRAGEAWSITNVQLSALYRASEAVSASFAYSDRQNFWDYLARGRPDSLFHDAARRGWRLRTRWRTGGGWFLTVQGGLRKHASLDGNTYSYGASASRPATARFSFGLDLRLFGFSGPYATGLQPSCRISKRLQGDQELFVASGLYSYRAEAAAGTRRNQWIRLGGRQPLTERLQLSLEYEYDWGDDTLDHRLLGELGYRF